MTPIQQLIVALAKHEKAGKDKMIAECIVMARRFLPSEKELLSKVFDAGMDSQRTFGTSKNVSKEKFFDQLYSRK